MEFTQDPLIVGPKRAEVEEEPRPQLVDLNKTNPFEDLYYLFRSPKKFFVFLYQRQTHSLPLFLKAFLGTLFFSWFSEFTNGLTWADSFARESHQILLEPSLRFFLRDIPVSEIQARLFALFVFFSQLKMVLAPIWSLLDVVGLSASVMIFLPWLGVPRSRLNFFGLLVVFFYAKWFLILALIPKVGPFVASIVVFAMTVKAIQWSFSISSFRALCASYLLHSFCFIVLPLAGLGFGGLLYWVLFHTGS